MSDESAFAAWLRANPYRTIQLWYTGYGGVAGEYVARAAEFHEPRQEHDPVIAVTARTPEEALIALGMRLQEMWATE